MKNRITGMLKIPHPILLGGMAGVTDAGLVAAVSEAGGMGTIGAFKESGESLSREIRQLRSRTHKPFAVNIPLVVPQTAELIATVLENRVPVVVTAAGNPAAYTTLLKESGICVIHVVSCVDMAKRAEEAGVDAVIAEGLESGGFASPYEIGTLALVPQVVDALRIPVLAAGASPMPADTQPVCSWRGRGQRRNGLPPHEGSGPGGKDLEAGDAGVGRYVHKDCGPRNRSLPDVDQRLYTIIRGEDRCRRHQEGCCR